VHALEQMLESSALLESELPGRPDSFCAPSLDQVRAGGLHAAPAVAAIRRYLRWRRPIRIHRGRPGPDLAELWDAYGLGAAGGGPSRDPSAAFPRNGLCHVGEELRDELARLISAARSRTADPDMLLRAMSEIVNRLS